MKVKIKTELIENFLKSNNMTKTKFCEICKISLPTLNKIFKNQFNFKLTALFKVARALGINSYEMFE